MCVNTIGAVLGLGKGPATKSDEFSEKCQRGGVHFQSKNLYCRFWELSDVGKILCRQFGSSKLDEVSARQR